MKSSDPRRSRQAVPRRQQHRPRESSGINAASLERGFIGPHQISPAHTIHISHVYPWRNAEWGVQRTNFDSVPGQVPASKIFPHDPEVCTSSCQDKIANSQVRATSSQRVTNRAGDGPDHPKGDCTFMSSLCFANAPRGSPTFREGLPLFAPALTNDRAVRRPRAYRTHVGRPIAQPADATCAPDGHSVPSSPSSSRSPDRVASSREHSGLAARHQDALRRRAIEDDFGEHARKAPLPPRGRRYLLRSRGGSYSSDYRQARGSVKACL